MIRKRLAQSNIFPDSPDDVASQILLLDHLGPEDVAMLQALKSRSADWTDVHLEHLERVGSEKFMSSYYVNYGHKSIADCGSTTLFADGVSMLAAKAIQDWPLYSGQETSSRFIDMSRQRIVEPFVGSDVGRTIMTEWIRFYVEAADDVEAHVRELHPKLPETKQDLYDRAVSARRFDILRGFLPAGITTNLSWHSNLRQAGDHLNGLVAHPATEVRVLGRAMRDVLGERYPSSGGGMSLPTVSGVGARGGTEAREAWEKLVADRTTYWRRGVQTRALRREQLAPFSSSIANRDLRDFADIFETRPRGCVLPHFMTRFGQVSFGFYLDFGSFRDLQRHRNGVCLMPLLLPDYGFNEWYLDQLPEDLHLRAVGLLDEQEGRIRRLPDDPVARQYYVTLGYDVPCSVTYGLPAAVYVGELRTGKMIHPTLRGVTREMVRHLRETHPIVTIHADESPGDWDVRRGGQTIERVS